MSDPNQQGDQAMGGDDQMSTQPPDYQSCQGFGQEQEQAARLMRPEGAPAEEVVQVVYRSDQHGSLVGVESTSLLGSYSDPSAGSGEVTGPVGQQQAYIGSSSALVELAQLDGSGSQIALGGHQQLSRAASTLPSVAEESSSSGPNGNEANGGSYLPDELPVAAEARASPAQSVDVIARFGQPETSEYGGAQTCRQEFATPLAEPASQASFENPIYSTVNKHPLAQRDDQALLYSQQQQQGSSIEPDHSADLYTNQGSYKDANEQLSDYKENLGDDLHNYGDQNVSNEEVDGILDDSLEINQEIGQIISRQKAGAVERGSFRQNFRKKLGLSVSTNESDLISHRQKFIEQVQDDDRTTTTIEEFGTGQQSAVPAGPLASRKFKRTNSVSFNVHASRNNRHSVDIRNLPSYLTHKRASIVDVAKGAMSSLLSSLSGGGGGGGGGSSSNSIISASHRRESMNYDDDFDEEPIFEEPIAPTLSLGQRVAMMRNSGTEFGTVGWIGQLPDFDEDWIVGVIFDNMIGDCDGAYKDTRYFYARKDYAMFVPIAVLTKTDNYIGRPETGTVLSRMSVSLKPGQLISIQRSSIRLQHCFLNAPHQRVGHDVRAVSNRLHCQCHNCGPCAHLTKQGRPNVLPHFGAHHLPIKKKNSLAHAAVEMLAHHHHHFHEEEEQDEKDYEFGDNAAHACNFVRYSCCQQSGHLGHEFSNDCSMVRPELLDNLIHAPKAPHRRSRPKWKRQQQHQRLKGGDRTYRRSNQLGKAVPRHEAIEAGPTAAVASAVNTNTLETNQSTLTGGTQTMSSTMRSSPYETASLTTTGDELAGRARQRTSEHGGDSGGSPSSYLSSRSNSGSSSSSSAGSSRSGSPLNAARQQPYNYYQYDTSSFRPQNNVYKTVESQVNIVDQQRFVFRRDSSAVYQSPVPSNWSDEQDSSVTTSGFGTRLLRCLGCLKQRVSGRGPRRPRKKLSFRDKVLEYRRRQSTFVPSTLAKPHEDFASHGIIMHSQQTSAMGILEQNSDYSSCSRSSGSSRSSSRSNSPSHRPDEDGSVIRAEIAPQNIQAYQELAVAAATTTMTLEHGHPGLNGQLKSGQWCNYMPSSDEQYRRQLNYGDFNFGDGYDANKRQERSKDSALTDLAYSDTHKTNSSSDTLKYLIDQSINEQVLPPQPMHEYQIEMSPLSSSDVHGGHGGGCCGGGNASTTSDQVDISSPTASAIDHDEGDGYSEELRAGLEDLRLDPDNMDRGHQE